VPTLPHTGIPLFVSVSFIFTNKFSGSGFKCWDILLQPCAPLNTSARLIKTWLGVTSQKHILHNTVCPMYLRTHLLECNGCSTVAAACCHGGLHVKWDACIYLFIYIYIYMFTHSNVGASVE
jgi:hypothetical protein